ncbi:hypothetical protein DBV39_14635 [Orrella marina]|uniref:Uncharacterized protein n=2 Tax=Orrella marina TaxID=2163011 RepID=A0A2R4XLU2_9BURK|nr:hypothetical protein DBV39_14635 [Orrella marina]
MGTHIIKFVTAIVSVTVALSFTSAFSSEGSMRQYPMHAAALENNVDTVKQLIDSGVEIDARDQSGSTALLVAARANSIDAAEVLIEAGADANAKDNINDSAYLYSGARGHLEILKMTLAHGADLNSTNRYGGTALIPAAERGHVETVQTLVESGVAIDHVNNLGWTALLEAIILGNGGESHQQIVNILLEAGANPNLADRDGVSPLQHARARGYHKIEQSLLAAGGQ